MPLVDEGPEFDPEQPFVVGFTVLDGLCARAGGAAAVTQIFGERLAWLLQREGLTAAPTITAPCVTLTAPCPEGMAITLRLVHVGHDIDRGQWRIHVHSAPSFSMLTAAQRDRLATLHQHVAELMIAAEETEDVEAAARLD